MLERALLLRARTTRASDVARVCTALLECSSARASTARASSTSRYLSECHWSERCCSSVDCSSRAMLRSSEFVPPGPDILLEASPAHSHVVLVKKQIPNVTARDTYALCQPADHTGTTRCRQSTQVCAMINCLNSSMLLISPGEVKMFEVSRTIR